MATAKPKSRDEYTVGWVCALPKEQTAATAMLDELHPSVQKPPNDPNNYTLGSIGGHNVVIACLPKGQTGNHSAATIATWMVSTFPGIKFGLMVGIGGGVPGKKKGREHQVKLGDVVISAPTGQYPGVVHWDMGKTITGEGHFQRTGSLNNPPTLLLTAVGKLETEHSMKGPRMLEYIEALGKKWPKLGSKYKSDSLEDILFNSKYEHVQKKTLDDEDEGDEDEGDEDEGDEEDSCGLCDRSKIVKREKTIKRDALVHYGLIASGSFVIRNGIYRNKLNEHFGGEVLCIEMEAAGLMNNFPCVVIRGICDYADSHKNDDWQELAAAMAAACAKELLQYILPGDVAREPSAKDMLREVLHIVSKTGADVTQIVSIIEKNENLKILDWLTSKDYTLQQHKHIRTHQEGTGQWLLDSVEFTTWAKTEKQTLFCPGMPGSGKTILTALVINSLVSQLEHDPKARIAYIYFNFWQQEEHNVEDLFASLLKQLAKALPSLPLSVKNLYDDYKGKELRPPLDKILRVLRSVIKLCCSRAFVIIDALDECHTLGNCRMRFIEDLLGLQEWGVNIFATSRFIPDIMNKFNGGTRLVIRANNDDIRKYVNDQISKSNSVSLRNMKSEASAGIMEAADGIFLLAKLDLESLLDSKLPKRIREKLKNLPKGSKAYSQAYEDIMKRIEHQGEESVEFAKDVLSWVACAKRPLTVQELRHALAVSAGELRLDEMDLPRAEDLISVCAGLVIVDERSDIVRLFHYTAQEYFNETQKQWFPEVEKDITNVCVTYLSFDVFKTGFCTMDATFEGRLQSYQLYDYATHKWGHHAREVINLDPLVLYFLQNQAKVDASSQALFAIKGSGKTGYSQDFPKQMSGLHLTAYFGIEKAVQLLLDLYDSDSEDSYGRTPLSWAAENGHEAVVRLLLKKGANPKATDRSDMTPRSWATQGRHEAIVKLLSTSIQSPPSQPMTRGSVNNDLQSETATGAGRKSQNLDRMLKSIQMIKKNVQNDMEWQSLSQNAESMSTQPKQIKEQQENAEAEFKNLKPKEKTLAKEERDKNKEMRIPYDRQREIKEEQEYLSKQPIYTQNRLYEPQQVNGYQHKHTNAFQPLLNTNKAGVDSKHKNGQRAIQLAVEMKHNDIAQLLRQEGAAASQIFKVHHPDIMAIASSHNLKLLASASASADEIKLWDIATGQCCYTLKGHSQTIFSVAFSHDSKLLASASVDETIKLWDILTGQCCYTFKGHSEAVFSVAFSHDSKRLASVSNYQTIKLWDIATGQCCYTFKNYSESVSSIAFSHDSRLLASASTNGAKLWDLATGQCCYTFGDHGDSVISVAFSHDSKLLASASVDETIKLWNISTGQCCYTFKGHRASAFSVAFSQDSKLLASVSNDKTIKLWDIATGQCCHTVEEQGYWMTSVTFSHDAKLLACGSGDGTVEIWSVVI